MVYKLSCRLLHNIQAMSSPFKMFDGPKRGLQYQKNSLYSTDDRLDVADLSFVKIRIINIK